MSGLLFAEAQRSGTLGWQRFQWKRYRQGAARNGPKLVYLATVISLDYATFTLHPLLAAFWVPITGVGHCAQYHRVVWAYGQSRYAAKATAERRLPAAIFGNVWLYAALGITFGLVTLQGPGAGAASRLLARVLDTGVFRHAFAFLGATAGLALALKVVAALISGARLHHFYVDSKIWRVSRSAALAKNLNV